MSEKRSMEVPNRRLVAVWFADLVGFTRLASRDEDAALRLVDLFQEIARAEIARHRGTLVKFTGDGLLAWADSTAEAIQAAVALRDSFHLRSAAQLRPGSLRVGIHIGDIVVSSDGDVYGDGVNVAARIQTAAEPGSVVVSEDVWRQCRQRSELRFVSVGRRRLKGIQEPVWLHEVEPLTDKPLPMPEAGGSPDLEARVRSLAVLPFEVMGRGEEAEFLASGLHTDLLTALSKFPELTVIGRTSVLGLAASENSIAEIARALNVGTLVEGSLQAVGSRIRLTVQLIDGRDATQTWAEYYDRELSTESLFEIQTELTQRIVESLHAKLAPEPLPATSGPATEDLEAYRLAVQARSQFDLKTEEGFLRAAELFEAALNLDPMYAPAQVGLANALALMEDYGFGDSPELLARAEEAARRALELAPDSSEAYTALGMLLITEQDGPGAIDRFEQAIELSPSDADAHNWHSWMSLLTGQATVALEHARRAVELNPLDVEAITNLALSYHATGQPEAALREAHHAGKLSPGYHTATFYEGVILYHLDRFDEAQAVLAPLSVAVAGEPTVPWAGLGPDVTLALARLGQGQKAQAEIVMDSIDAVTHPFEAGMLHAVLGEPAEAFEAFATVEQMHAWATLAVHHYYPSVWQKLMGDSRFDDLVEVAYRSWRV